MIKKTGVFLLFGMLLFGLCACQTSRTASEATTEEAAISTAALFANGINEDGTLADVNADDYVTLCDYTKITVKKSAIKPSDDEVDDEINELLESYVTVKEVTDRAVKNGDTVNIAYEGTIDGEAFEGGSADSYDLLIGSGTFIDDFEEQLIGKKPGDTVTVAVTFPEDYSMSNLAGKDASFEVTIHYIAVEQEPELTDDFVRENFTKEGYTSVKDMKKKIRADLRQEKLDDVVANDLLEQCKFTEIPRSLVEPFVDAEIGNVKAELADSGYNFTDYLNSYNIADEAELRESYYSEFEKTVKMYLIYDAIADREGITVEESELSGLLDSGDVDSLIAHYSKNYIYRMALDAKVLKDIEKNVTVK